MPINNSLKLYPLVPASPDKYIIERRKDQFWPARFGHINYLINRINDALGLIRVTLAEAQQLMQTNQVIMSGQYYITNAPNTDDGLYVVGTSDNTFANNGIAGFYVPAYSTSNPNWSTVFDDTGINFVSYAGSWNMNIDNYTTGTVVTFNGLNWICANNTVIVPADPLPFLASQTSYRPGAPGNTKWIQLPKKLTNGYFLEWDDVFYVINATGSVDFRARFDRRGNEIYDLGNINTFKWGCNDVTRNYVSPGSTMNCINAINTTKAFNNADLTLNILTNNSNISGIDFDNGIFRMTLDNQSYITNFRYAQVFRGELFTQSGYDNFVGFNNTALGRLAFAAHLNLYANSSLTNFRKLYPINIYFGYQSFYSQAGITNWTIESNDGPFGYGGLAFQFNIFHSLFLNFRNNYFYQARGSYYQAIASGAYNMYFGREYNTLTGYLNMDGDNAFAFPKTFATGAGSNTLTDATAAWAINQYQYWQVIIVGGQGAGQIRLIAGNSANTLTVTAWETVPNATSEFVIQNTPARFYTGFVGGGSTANTLVNTENVWAVNEFANFQVVITRGTGAGQIRDIVSNTGGSPIITNILTLSSNWTTIPDATSRFIIQGPAYDLATKRLKIPYGYDRLGEIWLWNTGGEEIEKIHGLSAFDYRGGTKFKVISGTGVTFKYTPKAGYVPATPPPGMLGPADVTVTNQLEFCQVEGINQYLYMKDSASFA